ncbi:MAG: HAD family hydrolase [Kiritimatiellia bacterium]
MKPAAFLFDLDGTLVDSETLWAQAIVDWLADRGQTTTVEAFAPVIFGHSWLDIHAAIHAQFPALGATAPVEDAKTLRPYYNCLATDPSRLVVPGTVAFLKKAAKIAPCVIVSGSPHADVEAAAGLCGVSGLVRFVLGAEDYGRGKPAPDGFLRAAELLDVDASECVVVEDSTAGVAAGRAAGMHVIGLDRNRLCPQNFSGSEWLVHDLSELDIDVLFDDEARGLRESVQFILKNSVQKVGHAVKKTLNSQDR